MKISKDSWHYRFIKAMDRYPKDNLCPYVWQVILNALLCILIFFLAIAVLTMLTYPIWRWWDQDGLVGFISGCLWIAIGVAAIKLYHEEWTVCAYYLSRNHMNKGMLNMERWYHRQLIPKAFTQAFSDFEMPRPAHDNVVLEYARAAHDKVCPRIEFTDNE